jgi:hypothetical protein
MKKAMVVAGTLSLVLAMGAPARANHAWSTYHWGRTANPFTLTVIDSVTGVWDSLLPQVTSDWASSSVLNLSTTGGATDLVTRLLCQPNAGRVVVCNANYGPNLWFGLATVWLTGGHISQATTQVNDYYFTGSYGNNTARRHVLCQEVGHDFGLDHQHVADSCMEDNNSRLNLPGAVSPNSHDYQQLQTIYAHLDPSNSFRARALPGSGSTPYVRTVGDTTIVTYIFWVD